MPARNLAKWNTVPGKLQDGEYVDSRIYSDQDIFDKEIKTIFTKVWIPVCHESEIPEINNFRTSSIANVPIIIVRDTNDVKAFSILGISVGIKWEKVQEKFKKLVKKFHPDMNAGNKKFEDKLKIITLAYTQLKNTYREKN